MTLPRRFIAVVARWSARGADFLAAVGEVHLRRHGLIFAIEADADQASPKTMQEYHG